MTINPFFMKEGYTRKRLVHTGFMGIVNTDLRFDENLRVWDDPDFNCQVIREYGSVVSLNAYGADIDRFAEGGCSKDWQNKETVDAARAYFFEKNGGICTIGKNGLIKIRNDTAKALGL